MKWLVLLTALLVPKLASAQDLKDRFNIKLSLTGMYVTESADAKDIPTNPASQYQLGYADLRAVIDGRRMPGNFELHIDGRVRVSGELDTPGLYVGAGGVTARGYLGGREYELREAYVRRRGASVDFALGRQYVVESDALKIDGVRLWYRFKKHWDLSLYAGGYPNPYSRSLTTDYQGASGYYGVSIAAGADIRYIYDKVWGSVSLTGAYLGGNDDGGRLDLANPNGKPSTEAGRVYLTWNSFERFVPWLDLYHDLVLDLLGSGGVQLTRLDAFVSIRAGKRFTIRAGFDHLSALAIEMFLTNLLATRADFAATTTKLIENNLIVSRTARDTAHADLDLHVGMLDIFAEGRLRWRTLVNAGEDPQFVVDPKTNSNQVAASFAWDATIGVRDRGSLKGLRLGLWYTLLDDFRSTSNILGIEIGRSFLAERLSFDLDFLYAKTHDQAVGAKCVAGAPNSPSAAGLLTPCFGSRDGASYEPSITFIANLSRHWFTLLDYRMVVNETTGTSDLLTHVLLLRIEARY